MIESLVDQIEARFAELERQMSDPAVIADRERYAEVGREYRELEPAHELARKYVQLRDDLEGARELLAEDGDDPELRKLVAEAPGQLAELGEQIRLATVERDPNDDKNVLVEVRAGAGGDEAALFAGDLFKMLTRYAEQGDFATEVLSQSPAEVGGFKEVTFAVKGEGAYSVFKYEGGTHRVQRVPKTESQGRIHTSTATVAVLPEAEEVDVEIDPNELQVDVYRSSGPGGQSVNTTDSAVRVTHQPTGITVSMQDEKSQRQNREKAMRVLRARLYEQKLAEQQAEIASERRSQVGSGERAEKVRTYNFPQGRVTDHRVKLTAHNLDQVLAGDLHEFTDALAAEEKRRRLESQAAEAASLCRAEPPPEPCARPWKRPAMHWPRPGSKARGWTPSCSWPRRRAQSGRGWSPSRRRRSIRPLRGASERWCAAESVASRSPTSWAARAFAASSSRSTAAR
jgi:peptide chain release factor 1